MAIQSLLSALIVAFLLAYPTPAPAGQNEIEARVAAASASIRDDLLVPLAFTGPALELRARYSRIIAAGRLEATLRFGAGYLFDRFKYGALALHHEVSLDYRHRMANARGNLWELGAVTRLGSDISYVATWDNTHGYWLACLCIGPAARYERLIGHVGVLHAALEFTLLGMLSRPPAQRFNHIDALTQADYYFNRIAQSPAFASLHNLQQLRLELGVLRRPSAVAAGWEFGVEGRFSHAADPESTNLLYLGVYVARGWAW
jgi:hypothetical protein